jgi:hypothetical protein
VQSKQTMDVCVCDFARMVAWESVFLLQCQETNEVLLLGSHIAETIVRWVPLSEADDVV